MGRHCVYRHDESIGSSGGDVEYLRILEYARRDRDAREWYVRDVIRMYVTCAEA